VKAHWTERGIKDYLFRIAADFVAQLERKLEAENITQDELAKRLKITKGRVSQVLNHPGNISLANIVTYARALGMKMSIVAYEDSDPGNVKGPINAEIFRICWEKAGKPRDFWAVQETYKSEEMATNVRVSTAENVEILAYRIEEMMHGREAVNVTGQIMPTAGRIPDTANKYPGEPGAANSTESFSLGGIHETK
jgi:transcriptional regulator with XRE-family HTH domain